MIKPTHYDLKINPLEYIRANNLGFVEGCIVKYISRYNMPGCDAVSDLRKIITYCQVLLDEQMMEQIDRDDAT